MKINKDMGLEQCHLGMMEMISVVAWMMDMVIVMLKSQQAPLFLNLDRFVGLSTCLSHAALPLSHILDCTQVNKVEVQYDKTSKQVDVHALKETLWGNIQLNQSPVEVTNLDFIDCYSTTAA